MAWSLKGIKSVYQQMKAGKLDSMEAQEVEENIKGLLPDAISFVLGDSGNISQKHNVVKAINELSNYYIARVEESVSPQPSKNKKAEAQPGQKKTATQLYKEKFGKQPAQVYRATHEGFNKADYARWLSQAVK